MTQAETKRGLLGAWRLARLDASAMTLFNQTPQGFWNSFYGCALFCILPTLVSIRLQVPAAKVAHSGWPTILLVEGIGFIVRLTAFPLAMSPFCRWLGRDNHFLGFVVAYNWLSVLQTGLLLAAVLLEAQFAGTGLIVLVAFLVSMAYEWVAIRIALGVGALPATTIVLLDIVLTLLINRATDGLY